MTTFWEEYGPTAELLYCSECGKSNVALYKFDFLLQDEIICKECASILEIEEGE